MRFQFAIFDLDGTLVDSHGDIADALNAALAESGLPTHPVADIEGMIGDGVGMLVARALLPEHADQAPQITTLFRARYAANLVVKTRVYPGLRELCDTARARGIRLAIATNKPTRFARAVVDTLGLADLFSPVVGEGDPPLPRKPDPAMVEYVLSQLGATHANSLYVGDSPVDAQTAKNAGLPLALVTWGYTARAVLAATNPDWLVDDAAALQKILLDG
jgi:phosphoglycolate phosphatase